MEDWTTSVAPSLSPTGLPQRRRWPFVVAIVVLLLLCAALGAGVVYETNAAKQWRDIASNTAEDLTSMTQQRDAVNGQFASAQSQLSTSQKSLSDVTAQYNTASDRIRSLSNEKAQVGDKAALLAELVGLSKTVTGEMDTCISSLQSLEVYLVDFQSYDATSLTSYVRSVNAFCNQARADSDALSRKLAG